MEYIIKNYNEEKLFDNFSNYILGIDIGGTNTNLAIAGIKDKKPNLLFSHNYKTNKLDSIIPAIENILSYSEKNFKIIIDFTCIGAAGVVSSSNDFVQLTNAEWNINSNEIINKTSLNPASCKVLSRFIVSSVPFVAIEKAISLSLILWAILKKSFNISGSPPEIAI